MASASASASSTEGENDIIIDFDTELINDIFTRRRSNYIYESNNVNTVVNFKPKTSGQNFLVVTSIDIRKEDMLSIETSGKDTGHHTAILMNSLYTKRIKFERDPVVVGIIDGRMRIIIKSNGSSCLQPQAQINDINRVTVSFDVSYKFTEDFNKVFDAAFNESKTMKKLALQSTLNNQHKEYSFNNDDGDNYINFKLTKNRINYTVNAKAEIQGKGKKWGPSQDIAYDDWKSIQLVSNIGIPGVPSNAGLLSDKELFNRYDPSPENNSTTIVVLDTPSGGSNKYNGGKNKTQIHHRRRFRKTNKRKNKKRTMRRSKRRNNK